MRIAATSLMLTLSLAILSPAQARPGGNPNFSFDCRAGRYRIGVTTEDGRLVLRLTPGRGARLQIVEGPTRENVSYLYRWEGPTSSAQQLRFRDGLLSYVIYNYFGAPDRSGRGAVDESGLMVLDRDRIVSHRRCTAGGMFDEDHRLDRLPLDPLVLRIPGLTGPTEPGAPAQPDTGR